MGTLGRVCRLALGGIYFETVEKIMIYGYARVSTEGQEIQTQVGMLAQAGAVEIVTEFASGKSLQRPKLVELLSKLKSGDCLMVVRLDRLGRSLIDLVSILDRLGKEKIDFLSLSEGFDTQKPHGRLLYQMAGAFAEYERALISERTREGLAHAAAAGRRPGRKPVLSPAQCQAIFEMKGGERSNREIAKLFGVSETTVRKVGKQ